MARDPRTPHEGSSYHASLCANQLDSALAQHGSNGCSTEHYQQVHHHVRRLCPTPDHRRLGDVDVDENITLGLHIGEGVETCLALPLAVGPASVRWGFRP